MHGAADTLKTNAAAMKQVAAGEFGILLAQCMDSLTLFSLSHDIW